MFADVCMYVYIIIVVGYIHTYIHTYIHPQCDDMDVDIGGDVVDLLACSS